MKRIFLALCIIILSVTVATAREQLDGPWNGEINVSGQAIPLVFRITDNGTPPTVTVDSPLQGAKDLPATIKLADDGSVEIEIALIGARFSGSYADGSISGKFTQSGMSFPLRLKRGEYEMPRPQTPREPFVYETQEVTITNPNDSALLAGTLTLPLNYNLPMVKNLPVVVMVTGSGQQNRDEEILRHKPFAVLAHHLALNGIASLRYDDRGFAKSTGDLTNATTATFASDARAAIDYARKHIGKAGMVGVLGHSEGGTIAYMLGASGDADFIVSLAGPAVSGAEVLKAQNRALLEKMYPTNIVDEYVQALDIVFDYMAQHPKDKAFDSLDAATEHLTALPTDLKQNLHQIVKTANPWLTYFITYNPAGDIAAIHCPVFALFGELDTQVDAAINSEALRTTLPESSAADVKVYPGLNHLFQHATTGLPTEYGQINETISEEVIADIIARVCKLDN